VPRIPQLSVYSGTKAAGEQFVKSLAVELAPKRITVNSISPGMHIWWNVLIFLKGYTDTDMLPGAFHSEAAKASVFGRVGTAQEVAEVAGFLASSAGRWVTVFLESFEGFFEVAKFCPLKR
jgi:3-oxoacyl-[acyl-carrier protein] reductase